MLPAFSFQIEQEESAMEMTNVLGLILGGGQGQRLYPLTKERAKPAVPLAGKYRLIDIPMSNCLHADIEKIAILTQFNSVSLHRHIYSTYVRDVFTKGWVQILAAEQTPRSADWYQGTADAVRKQRIEIREAGTDYVLILAGDHLYRMDYRRFCQYHVDSEADVTIAVQPVGREQASGLGILKLSPDNQITDFVEKPQTAKDIAGFDSRDDPEKPYMASMGIYVFNYEAMIEMLDTNAGIDFGKHIIPAAIKSHRVVGYVFDDFWEDIGTIGRFYEVNLMMTTDDPPFDFFSADRPIYTHPRFLPGSEVHKSRLEGVLLGDGCRIYGADVNDSVIGLRSQINYGVTIRWSIIMGADDYETEAQKAANERLGQPNMGIGDGSVIEGAIIDKNARIGRNVTIRRLLDRPNSESENWVARDGLVIVPKGAVIPDGTII
jgi:glucose-1-phosphate adenylyltransferase